MNHRWPVTLKLNFLSSPAIKCLLLIFYFLLKYSWSTVLCLCCSTSDSVIHVIACVCVCVSSSSVVSDSSTPCTGAHRAPLPMWFARQEYWSGLPFPYSRVIFPTQESNPRLLCLMYWQALSYLGSPLYIYIYSFFNIHSFPLWFILGYWI